MVNNPLPPEMHRYFWDTDPSSIDVAMHKQYVIERMLQWGGLEAWKWLGSQFSRDDIVQTVKTSSRIPKRDGQFYASIYQIPYEEVKCLNPEWRAQHRQIWDH